ncbi:hypothetical protein M902_0506 [Bacteriovorax sp. BAL6_X]|uniref:hypothetical protein n=1 Tax=Bacteriovorax sp. BAL6_X TaxID=1201290 RepID=UPI0003868457|nr:hypothetical protein [Bacteriovorax sp. BAL6_X]EPZ49970.1 hypothetical protein M902_0506 [Bacteriovorax sp. BAL6_X]
MPRKMIKLLTLVLLLSAPQAFGSEFELFDRLKEDMWNLGLDFEYVHTADLKLPNTDAIHEGGEMEQGQLLVKSVPYELIHRFERSF